MSLNEIATQEATDTEGDDIQAIEHLLGSESFSELSTSNSLQEQNKSNNNDIKEIQCNITQEKLLPKEPTKKTKDLEKFNEIITSSSNSSNNDICRICHMGNSLMSMSNQNCSVNGEVANQEENRTSSSHYNLGLLVSACRCRGTVGLVHTKCLERWLTESGHTRCELCGYRYATIRVPRHGILRSFLIWIKTFVATRQMLLDTLYLVVTTPLAVFSAYVCAMTLKMALENRIGDIPWTIVAMLPTCSLTLVAYWGWLLTLQRLHGRRWRQYWQSNFIVQLIPDSPVDVNQSNDELDLFHEDIYEDLPELFNII